MRATEDAKMKTNSVSLCIGDGSRTLSCDSDISLVISPDVSKPLLQRFLCVLDSYRLM